MRLTKEARSVLEKVAYGYPVSQDYSAYPTVGISNPQPTVSSVLSAIGLARVNDVGTPGERRDAFGRIVSSGLETTSPADNALGMIGGGLLGRFVAGSITNNKFVKGLGAGLGAISAIRKY